jgi:hypothetical protein
VSALLEAPIDREARRARVRALDPPTLDGIEFVEVLSNHAGTPGHVAGAPQQRTLLVHLIVGPVPADLGADRVHVLGGVRVDPLLNPVRTEWAYPADAVAGGEGELPGVADADRALVAAALEPERRARALVVRTSSSGDWSTYVLALVGAGGEGVPAGFDEPLASEPFRFTVDCPSDLDCRIDDSCPPVPATTPAVDYLARDYAALRTRLLDRVAALVPGWRDTNPADPIVTLIELLAAAGDRLTYWQDAIAAESYLTTARRRPSVRRHARLLDYLMHEGCAARTWLAFTVDSDVDLPDRTPFATADPVLPPSTVVADAVDAGATVFETRGAAALRPARNLLELHAWGDVDACLPAGSTAAYIRHPAGADPQLDPGDVVVLVPVDGDERRRQAVRLDRAPVVRVDPLAGGDTVLELHWAADDALEVPLPVATRAADGTAAPAAQALANVVLAEHAATLAPQPLAPPQVPLDGTFRPRLPVAGVAWVDETVDDSSATAALLADPRSARAQVALVDEIRTWEAQPDLLASGRLDAHFVAEPEASGLVRLRFGEGTAGRRPTAGSEPLAYVRVGGGSEGNVGADVLTTPLATTAGPAPGGVLAVTNPLAALGGQPAEAVQELAPHAFRTQLRAVTSSDYADVAGSNAGVQRAVARRRWAGSWYAQEVTLDLVAARAGDASVAIDVAALLDVRRLAGVDVELAPPVPVALEIVIGVCVADGHARADVAAQVGRELSAGALRDGRLGFFHPDNFSFGQTLFLSDLVARVMAVPGVAWVDVEDSKRSGLRFRRFGRPPAGEVAAGRIDAAAREVLRADSDPSNPENGRVGLILRGGT